MEHNEWLDLLKDRGRTLPLLELSFFMNQQAGDGGSHPLLGRAVDGRRYWVKQASNPQGAAILATEQIVARLGALIGAPTCEVQLIQIPGELAGIVSGVPVEPGVAHGSLDVPGSFQLRRLSYRSDDDNQRRHAGVFALYDWCFGNDPQWLYDAADDQRTYSHDHGYYFPNGPGWVTVSDFSSVLGDARPVPDALGIGEETSTGLDVAELTALADRIDGITPQDIGTILCGIPNEWPVDSGQLALIGAFLDERRAGAASRLRVLI